MSDVRNFFQGASNSAASSVSAPVDGIAWLLRKAGLAGLIGNAPVGGSDWMAQRGLTAPAPGVAGLLGESAGGVAPLLAAAKAPQIAKGLLTAQDNYTNAPRMFPGPGNSQRGAVSLDYGMAHRPVTVEGGAARLDDLTPAFGEDIYGKNAAQFFGTGAGALDRETLRVLNSVRNKPDAMVTVYRAVPKDASAKAFNYGDWVTVNKTYAKQHGESTLEGNYRIIEQKVPASHLTTNADSFHEQGFHPPK